MSRNIKNMMDKGKKFKQSHKTIALWLLLVLFFVGLFHALHPAAKGAVEISFSQFVLALENKHIEKITFKGKDEILGAFKQDHEGGKRFFTVGSTGPEIFSLCRSHGITPDYEKAGETPFWQTFLISWGPVIFLFLFFFFFLRQLHAGGGKALAFGKSRARMITEDVPKINFSDVAGVNEAKEELQEVVDFLKEPKRFTRLGGRLPRGVLLIGPPGTGKTLLAKAVAGEAKVPFFSISGSDFVEMFVGVGASRVRDLFEQGKRHAPCIIFMDEIDAVGRHRGAGLGGGHDEREQTLNQLLVEMDGFDTAEGVILIAATNRPDVLDPALLRPGRFDRNVVVPSPDVKGREAILKVHTRKKPLSEDVNLLVLAKGTPGFSGADLENLVNEAALFAAKNNRSKLSMRDFEYAKDKVTMGPERKSLVMTAEERRNTSYHEAGHALVAKLIPGTDPVHKVSIVPRGAALGVTQILPSDDRLTITQEFVENSISFMMGGRVAEELIFGHRTSGAGDDFKKATELARKMVCEWGMSEKIGPLVFGRDTQVFLGRDMAQLRPYSEQTARVIDEEIAAILERNYERAKRLLKENIKILHDLAEALLEREALEGDEVDRIMRGEKLGHGLKMQEEVKKEESIVIVPTVEPSLVS